MTLGAALAAVLTMVPAANASQTFNTPVKLSNPPSAGEPSIAADPSGNVMVASPQGIPAGANGSSGTGLWISGNSGDSFAQGTLIGSYLGGGDDDVIYDQGTWYEADLEAAATEICQSTDTGKTWTGVGPLPDPSNCTTINAGQAGPSDDRQWLTADPTDKQRVYLTYHEFVSAQPVAFRTDNGGGDDFANACGSLVTDPTIESNVPTDITGGTLVARPVVDKSGRLYVLFATTTQQENAQAFSQGQPSGTFSQLYLAVSKDHCQTFTDYTVFDGQAKYGLNTVQFGDIFNDLAIDGAGNLYVIGAGYVDSSPNTANIYLFNSTDHGQQWNGPYRLDNPSSAHMLPAAVGGPQAGQLAVGYFRTINGVTDPNSSSGKWTYSTAYSTDASTGTPSFSYADPNPNYDYHNGEICNLGILCGTIPGQPSDRSLLDFTSVTLAPGGCPLYVFAGNPTGTAGNNTPQNTNNYVTRQLTECFSASGSNGTSGSSGTSGSGGTGGSGGSGGGTTSGPSPTPNGTPATLVGSGKPHKPKHKKHKKKKKHKHHKTRRHATNQAAPISFTG